MHVFYKILRFLLGSLFIFSGFVKLVDPKGTEIKLEEYFTAFSKISDFYIGSWAGAFFDFIKPFSLYFSVGLSSLEIVLGIAVMLWIRPRVSMLASVCLLVFFGFLTGYSSQCDPNNAMGVSCVTDCGCFGDFLKLRPIESFYKDLILLILAIPLFLLSRKEKKKKSYGTKDFILYVSIMLCILFGVYNTINLPIIDFRPYKVGNNLLEKRSNGIPAKNVYILEKEGKQEKFEVYPEGDYKYIGFEEVEPEVLPSISDFYLFDSNGDDLTENELTTGRIFLIFKNLEELNEENYKEIQVLLSKSKSIAILTGSPIEKTKSRLNFTGPIYNLDETVLKAIVRNYPSIMHVEKAIVVEKKMLKDYLKQLK